jgi:AcrR family transcriptional regulator
MASLQVSTETSRREILDAAEKLMAERGFRATSIAEVCAASKSSVGSIYWHFKSKDGLLAAVMERGSLRFLTDLPKAASFPGTPRQRFDAWFAANSRLLARRPQFLRIHLSLCLLEQTSEEVASIIQGVRDHALLRIGEALAPWVAENYGAESSSLTDEFASYMLAYVDGAFIAQHFQTVDIFKLLDRLHTSLVVQVEQCSRLT